MTNLCLQPPNMSQVLDLMVRMLGFTEEDRQRIGFAQHAAGKGIVRGMLGLPGRLVGGFLGGLNSPETSSSDNLVNSRCVVWHERAPHNTLIYSFIWQSFADLWVDFLLKETEERERRLSSEALGASSSQQDGSAYSEIATKLPSSSSSPTDSRLPSKHHGR
ncbi:hypothetical protein B296_00017697 [Ensete ventricosum]|uniref:Uncharacterized protein n=1 Tax=Ensete ventricosum TaxID=4639 RepID=A0A427B2W0_ENSVE|nr:hypothetical protein B296_00017697 [Ensete ventricosum]